jgi:hypothetical protein
MTIAKCPVGVAFVVISKNILAFMPGYPLIRIHDRRAESLPIGVA